MADEKKSGIPIGENQRIHWVEFDAVSNDFADVDYVVAKHPDFWAFLEINCVAGCCGLDAFRFYPDDIIHASTQIDKEALKEDLKIAHNCIEAGQFISGSFNISF
jgi:hypothetical protein